MRSAWAEVTDFPPSRLAGQRLGILSPISALGGMGMAAGPSMGMAGMGGSGGGCTSGTGTAAGGPSPVPPRGGEAGAASGLTYRQVALANAPHIASEDELAQVTRAIQGRSLDGLRLHEFFLCDVPRFIQEVLQPALRNIDLQEMEAHRRRFEKRGRL